MAFELPDFWTTLGIGLALLSLVPGMTSVPSASHIEFKISRICALAAATLFLIKLALWGSEDLTAARIAIVALLGALIAVSTAFALHWINKKEKTTVVVTAEAKPESVPARGPTLEANTGGRINAEGATIPGDLPFQFGKAETGGIIDMPGINVIRQNDGSLSIQPSSKPANRVFLPPTGEFKDLSEAQIAHKLRVTAGELREFQKRYEAAWRALPRSPETGVENSVFQPFAEQWKLEYETKYINEAYSLVSESLARGLTITAHDQTESAGGTMLFYKAFAGPRPALEVAAFLDRVASELKPD
jgi:hypothetical protein